MSDPPSLGGQSRRNPEGDGGGIERERKETRIKGKKQLQQPPDKKKLPVSRLLHHPKENGL